MNNSKFEAFINSSLTEIKTGGVTLSIQEAKEVFTVKQAKEIFLLANDLSKVRELRGVSAWSEYISPEELALIQQQKLYAKQEKFRQAKVKGGIATQSPALQAALKTPMTFEHSSGISLTVLPKSTVKAVVEELNKTGYPASHTNLSHIIIGLRKTCKGWKLQS